MMFNLEKTCTVAGLFVLENELHSGEQKPPHPYLSIVHKNKQ